MEIADPQVKEPGPHCTVLSLNTAGYCKFSYLLLSHLYLFLFSFSLFCFPFYTPKVLPTNLKELKRRIKETFHISHFL